MRRIGKLTLGLLLVLLLGGCGAYSNSSGFEPMSYEEEDRYKLELYTKMTPAQRGYYEALPTRAERDDFLRQLGLLKTREPKKK